MGSAWPGFALFASVSLAAALLSVVALFARRSCAAWVLAVLAACVFQRCWAVGSSGWMLLQATILWAWVAIIPLHVTRSKALWCLLGGLVLAIPAVLVARYHLDAERLPGVSVLGRWSDGGTLQVTRGGLALRGEDHRCRMLNPLGSITLQWPKGAGEFRGSVLIEGLGGSGDLELVEGHAVTRRTGEHGCVVTSSFPADGGQVTLRATGFPSEGTALVVSHLNGSEASLKALLDAAGRVPKILVILGALGERGDPSSLMRMRRAIDERGILLVHLGDVVESDGDRRIRQAMTSGPPRPLRSQSYPGVNFLLADVRAFKKKRDLDRQGLHTLLAASAGPPILCLNGPLELEELSGDQALDAIVEVSRARVAFQIVDGQGGGAQGTAGGVPLVRLSSSSREDGGRAAEIRFPLRDDSPEIRMVDFQLHDPSSLDRVLGDLVHISERSAPLEWWPALLGGAVGFLVAGMTGPLRRRRNECHESQ